MNNSRIHAEDRIDMAKIKVVAVAQLVLVGLLAGMPAQSQDLGDPEAVRAIREVLTRTQQDMQVELIKPSPVKGLYEVNLRNGQVIYASEDAKYFIPGDLYESRPEGLVNLGEQKRNVQRAKKIAALDESEMIVFEAEGERKAVLTVFTDVDCPYCRQLHGDVPELNRRGIAVRYLAFPRTGLDTETHRKMISTWCADDPNSMLTSAKRGGSVPSLECDNPVASQYQLGREVGVTGTPALVLEDGTILPGYVPAETLADYLLDE